MRIVILTALLVCHLGVVFSKTQEPFPFQQAGQRQQFQGLLKELRCLVCQNQDLADSNAPLANDLKQLIYNKVQAHESNEQIKLYLVERYGNYILFKPAVTQQTFVLWLMPGLLVFIGMGWLWSYGRRQHD